MLIPCDFNLHTHTFRCHHAKGTDEEYVLKAIENGYKTIGFSDHAPYIFDGKHISNFRIENDLTENYVNSINKLKEKYKDKIDIKLGYEVEYYPQFFEKEMEYLKSFGYDYLILGQHYTGSEVERWARYTGHKTYRKVDIDRYVSQVIEGVKTGEFAYVAHPDIINFAGLKSYYVQKMEYLVKELKKLDIPLEYNFLGFSDKRQYPNDTFWKLVKKHGNRVVVGLDAHYPCVYEETEQLKKLYMKLDKLGLEPIQNVEEILK
ncbi:MAG: histidinol-phosphatase [Eubacterium sp.]|nr:histidinol-phosphatase [Eubacterium sp.]